jgi:hypothetical protein
MAIRIPACEWRRSRAHQALGGAHPSPLLSLRRLHFPTNGSVKAGGREDSPSVHCRIPLVLTTAVQGHPMNTAIERRSADAVKSCS